MSFYKSNLQRKHAKSAEPVVLAAAVQGGVVLGPAGEVGEVKQGNPVAVHRTPGQCILFVCLDTTFLKKSPGCEDTEDVHQEASLHHVGGPHAATGAVADGVGSGGHGQHEGVADAGGRGEHQVERVGAEREGHLTNQSRVQWSRDGCPPTTAHLGEDGDQDVGAGGVAGDLRDEGGHRGDDEADQQRVQALET